MPATSIQVNNASWPESPMHQYLYSTILPKLPNNIKDNIKVVHKTYYEGTELISDESIWIPSKREVTGTGAESNGIQYSNLFSGSNGTSSTRIRCSLNTATTGSVNWVLRSKNSTNTNGWYKINNDGGLVANSGYVYIMFGFCT